MNREISLFDIAKKYDENQSSLIGDKVRHMKWERLFMMAIGTISKNKTYRQYVQELSKMVKTKNLNGEVLEMVIEDMETNEKILSSDEIEALKILIALRNL